MYNAGQFQQGAPGGYGQPMHMQQHQQQHQQYAQQHYQHYQQQSQAYGGYGQFFQDNVFGCQAWQAFQFQQPNELQQIFTAEMMKNPVHAQRQAIQAEGLSNIMNNCQTIRNYFGISWSRELCSIMLAMLDRSQDGFMQWQEFEELQQCLIQWMNTFRQFDHDRSGFIEANELVNIIKTNFGYNVTPKCVEVLLKRYSQAHPGHHGQVRCLIAFDDFVACSVRLRAYTDAFRKRDQMCHGGQETGSTQMQYDDFLQCVMCL